MVNKLDTKALGYTAAIFSAGGMLLLGVLGNVGMYTEAVAMMQQWHIFFSLSIVGIILGMVEGAVSSFIAAYTFGWLYNRFV